MSCRAYKSCVLKGNQSVIVLEDGVEVEVEGASGPQVSVKADFASGFISITQLNEKSTRFPERDDLVMKTANDYCYLKHDEQIILSKTISYRIEFPPENADSSIRRLKRDRDPSGEPPAKKFASQSSEGNKRDFFRPTTKEGKKKSDSERNLLDGSWIDNEDLKVLYFLPQADVRSKKCACFDMDQTVIKTKSGKKFPVDHNDWLIMYNGTIPKKLKELHEEKYRIVVFSNQRGIATGKESKTNLKKKFTNIMRELGVPMTMFLSYGLGIYRKPCVGLWNLLEEENGETNKSESIYVGDAAGRPKGWQPGASKDHSKVDRLFALNVGVDFHTPEEFFLKSSKNKFEMPSFEPKKLRDNRTWGIVHEPKTDQKEFTSVNDLICSDLEIIVFVGYPASGKSTLAVQLSDLKGYVHINQDTLGSPEKCWKKAKDELKNSNSVIIDNTNFVKEQRQRYIDIAKSAGVSVRCFWFDCTLEQVRHNNKFRLLTAPDAKHKDISDVVLYTLRKKFEEPKLEEGFSQIVKIEMVPRFDNPQRENLYYMYLLEN